MTSEELRERLGRLGIAPLVEFLVQLAARDSDVAECIDALARRDDPSAQASALRERLTRITRGPDYVHDSASFDFADRLDVWLDDVESGLLPDDPTAAWTLVDDFIRTDRAVLECVDDSSGNVGDVYRCACRLWHQALAALPASVDRVEFLRSLHADNDYGVRDALLDYAATSLSQAELERLAEIYEREYREEAARTTQAGDHPSLAAAAAMGQVAHALEDAALYERSVRLHSPQLNTLQREDIARAYVRFGPVEKAVEQLGEPEELGRDYERLNLLDEAYERLGDDAQLREVRRLIFQRTLSPESFERYQAVLPEHEREGALRDAVETAAASEDAIAAAQLLLALDEADAAGALIFRERERLGVAFYATLVDLADALEATGCATAAVCCYRALVDQILDGGRSKAYRHAKRYMTRLAALDTRLTDYHGMPDHRGYVDRLRTQHGRKRSFWALVE